MLHCKESPVTRDSMDTPHVLACPSVFMDLFGH